MNRKHVEKLKEIQSLTESVVEDKRERYVCTITDQHGTYKAIENRESHLQFMLEVISDELDLLIEDIEEAEKEA